MTNPPVPSEPDEQVLSGAELEAQSGAPLPEREAMSTISHFDFTGNFAMPINEAIAINNQTVDSYAIADADQIVILNQDTEAG